MPTCRTAHNPYRTPGSGVLSANSRLGPDVVGGVLEYTTGAKDVMVVMVVVRESTISDRYPTKEGGNTRCEKDAFVNRPTIRQWLIPLHAPVNPCAVPFADSPVRKEFGQW